MSLGQLVARAVGPPVEPVAGRLVVGLQARGRQVEVAAPVGLVVKTAKVEPVVMGERVVRVTGGPVGTPRVLPLRSMGMRMSKHLVQP